MRVNAPIDDLLECLVATEERKGFTHRLTSDDLQLALELLGTESFRTYVSYSPGGEPASGRIILAHPGGMAADWVAGTKAHYLKHGVAQQVVAYALSDLAAAGVTLFDHVGANIASVAAAKADVGGRLVAYYAVEQRNARYIAKELLVTARGQWRRNS